MNGQVKETQRIWRRLPQEYQKQLIVLLGQMMQHQMETTIQRKDSTTRNAVDKTACLKHGGVPLKRGIV
jgi:hypothetical protein